MTTTLITNIGELVTVDQADRVLRDAALIIEGGRIAWIGSADQAPPADERFDAAGRTVLPGWVDSHTHLVFDGDRSEEFEARMAGADYVAGGISTTVEATRKASDAQLKTLVSRRIAEAVAGGTTYLETKTGYGLSLDEEARHARLLDELRQAGEVDAVTYLGAHLVPPGEKAESYTALAAGPMLEAVSQHVQWADVFCEEGAFTADQSRQVLSAAKEAGLGLRVHGNQLGQGPGVQLAVELGAASVDHVNYLSEADIEALQSTWAGWDAGQAEGTPGTTATCLPACDLSTRQPLAPARQLLDAGVAIALASNCNPGTSYTTSMNFNVSTAVLQMRLSLKEAIRAATFSAAVSLGAHHEVGSLEVGKRADLHMLDAPRAIHLAYRPGMPMTYAVWRKGQRLR
ncbi:imidazolonepropionase [Nesterenkonia alkaliphila]|uniref:Imidazolonepropionase n=1 Tax=Nesterenkonia alkaliphila TaxID=1463631 RepID=A0A7K1UJI1_9MICC|nr:imidazolonepropionase [Nesterenkonia alkaliphila]MVT26637.1 imidazolonepropionase [Nesterenkonia alkaliphila]GFZ92308.1 imidazolonepropionase [Nesterenkonia alkaliphila]